MIDRRVFWPMYEGPPFGGEQDHIQLSNLLPQPLRSLMWTFTTAGGTTPGITVTTPNGGESWTAGSTQDVTWTWTATVGNVDLAYSRDGGGSWTDIATGEANDGTYSWAIPAGIDSTQCRVRVQEADGDPTDTSDNDFTTRMASSGSGDDDGGGCVFESGSSAGGLFLVFTWLALAYGVVRRKHVPGGSVG